jgi:hypothetical protein
MKNRQISLVRAVPFLFALHNLEEALFMPAFLSSSKNIFPAFVHDLLGEISPVQFLSVLLPITILPVILFFIWKRNPSILWIPYFLCGLQFVIFFNIFSHAGSALLLKIYSPGLLTALLVNLPFSLVFFLQNARRNFFTIKNLPVFITAALLTHGPLLFGLLKLAGLLTS